jgi:hypothetical protein
LRANVEAAFSELPIERPRFTLLPGRTELLLALFVTWTWDPALVRRL